MISLISVDSYVFLLLPLSPTPYPYGLYHISIVMPHIGSTFFISTLCFLSHYLTLFFYALYIVDCMYTHVIPYLVLKAAMASKELYLSSLVYSSNED